MIDNEKRYARQKRKMNLVHIFIIQMKVHVLKAEWLTTRAAKQKKTSIATKQQTNEFGDKNGNSKLSN